MKSLLKILIALMLGMAVIFTAVSCSEDTSASRVEDEDDEEDEDEKDKKDSDEENEDDEEDEDKKSDAEDVKNDEGKKNDVKKDKNEDKPVVEEKSPEEAAEEALVNCLDCLVACDFEGMVEYTTDPGEYENSGITCADDLADSIIEGLDMETWFAETLGEANAVTVVDATRALYIDLIEDMDYEIIECLSADEEEAVFEVELYTPDFDNIDIMTMMGEDDGAALAMQALEEGVITEDMTEDEMIDALIPYMTEYMVKVIESAAYDVELLTETAEITVVNVDGEWLVDTDTMS
ncbi:MAG: hypothetical protein E7600_01760 [Ruminococcaceae bacterium]|nr:hypothetical protein [Oscillospiraceae bacterium]